MNLFADIRSLVLSDISAMAQAGELPAGLATANVTVEPPRDAAHGDMATNAAMVLAKPAGMKPRDIAEALAAQLARTRGSRPPKLRGRGFEPPAGTGSGRALNAVLDSGAAMAVRHGAGPTRQCGIRFRQSHRTACMWATRAALSLAMRWPRFWSLPATRSHANTTSTTAARRSMCSPGRYTCAIWRRTGRRWLFADGTYPGDYLIEVGQALKDKVGDAYVGKGEAVWLADVRNFATDAMMDADPLEIWPRLASRWTDFFSEKVAL